MFRTYAVEIEVVLWRLAVLVQRGAPSLARVEACECGGIPRDAEAVDVEEAVPCVDFVLCGYVVWVVAEEFGEVVRVDLFGEGVFLYLVREGGFGRFEIPLLETYGADEDVVEETELTVGDVGEPTGVVSTGGSIELKTGDKCTDT